MIPPPSGVPRESNLLSLLALSLFSQSEPRRSRPPAPSPSRACANNASTYHALVGAER
jgi:hypothetical protein